MSCEWDPSLSTPVAECITCLHEGDRENISQGCGQAKWFLEGTAYHFVLMESQIIYGASKECNAVAKMIVGYGALEGKNDDCL
jgi:hypothetical protein